MPRLIITEPDSPPQPYAFDLDRKVVRIGRAEDNEIVLTCGSISSYHAEMARVTGGFELSDLGSTNGVSRDGEKIDSTPLEDGTQLMLGDVVLDFTLTGEEAAALAIESKGGADRVAAHGGRPAVAKSPHQLVADARRAAGIPKHGAGDWWLLMLFLVLAAAAFYTGLSVRHQNETGVSLGQAIQNRMGSPDVSGAAERDPDPDQEAFIEPGDRDGNEDVEEPEIIVTPPEPEDLPPELEGWEDRERRSEMDLEAGRSGDAAPDRTQSEHEPLDGADGSDAD